MNGYLAEVRLFAGTFNPRNWAFCQGQLLPINTNQALFSLLGTTFGGDGRTTFGLPSLRGRTAIGEGHGAGLSNYVLGEKTGAYGIQLSSGQLPQHDHTPHSNLTVTFHPPCNNTAAGSDEPENTAPGKSAEAIYNTNGAEKMAATAVTITGNVTAANNGSSGAHENRMPSLASSYIICTSGLFPSRN